MRNIVNRLIEVGFSKTEAMIYMTLLKLGKANGYKLAKELDLSKSTIYQTLDSMYKVGYILLIPNGYQTEVRNMKPKIQSYFLKK